MRTSNRSEIRPETSGSIKNLLPAILGIVLSFAITISLFVTFSSTHEGSAGRKGDIAAKKADQANESTPSDKRDASGEKSDEPDRSSSDSESDGEPSAEQEKQSPEIKWRTSPNKKNITNEDLARLQRLTKWTVRLPEDLSSEDAVGISMKTAEGNKAFIGSSNFQPGSLISVFLRERDQKFHWIIVSENGSMTRSTTSVDQDRQGHTLLYASNKDVLQPGTFLIKGTEKPEKNRSKKLKGEDFAFTVDLRRNKDE